ncbi:MAG: aminoacyl-tRNA hydrolase [Hyphomicrobiaceae bacterium]|nr:aminoacyl-tRNA hydrolase [Hyphomicrobiaceae bacterium]
MLRVNSSISIDERELEERFIRSSGPGGQNVNKVATAVELRFDVAHSQALTEAVRKRLSALAGRRLTDEGVLVIRAERFRTQERNRDDARARLVELIREAAVPPKPRIKTRPTLASKTRRLDAKTRRSSVKKLRNARSDD